MAVECKCPQCAARYRVEDRLIGKRVRCKKCGATVTVPAPSSDEGINLDDLAALASLSGQSAIGESAAGKSSPGRSIPDHLPTALPTPAPSRRPVVDPDVPDLNLPMSWQTHAPAKARWNFGTPAMSESLAGMLATILLLGFFVLAGMNAYREYQAAEQFHKTYPNAPVNPKVFDNLGALTAIDIACTVGCFFIFAVPAFLVSAVAGSGVDKKNSPPLDAVRAAGVAAVPWVVALAFSVFTERQFGQRIDGHIGLLILLVSAVLTGLGIREIMQMKIGPTVVTFILYAVLGLAAMWGTKQTKESVGRWYVGEPEKVAPPSGTYAATPPPSSLSGISQNTPPPQAPAQDPYRYSLQSDMMAKLDERIGQTANYTKEQLKSFWQVQLDHFAKLTPRTDSPLYMQYAERIGRIRSMIDAAPSGEPPAEIFASLDNAFPLNNVPADIELLGQPVQLGPVVVTPLKTAKLDLTRFANRSATLSWTIDKMPGARVTLTLIPRRQPNQTRPWLTGNPIVQSVATTKGYYTLDMPTPMETVVKIGGLTMSRLSPNPGSMPAVERRFYSGVVGDKFVELAIQHDQPSDRTTLDQMEVMARSLHVHSEGEWVTDPFGAPSIVPRLEDDFATAAPILEAAGEAAEDDVLAWAKASGKPPTDATIALLRKIGTRKSAAFLAPYATMASASGAAAPPKPVEKPIIPAATVLEKFDLEVDPTKKIDMLESLARQTPGSNRTDIAKLLEGIVLAPGNDSLLPATGKALAVWHRPETIDALLPMLAEGVPVPYRRASMVALAGTQNPKCVHPIVQWMLLDPETAVPSLIAMGGIAEVDVIKLLRENNQDVRRNAARVLQEIGTSKSVVPLKNATGVNDPIGQQARDALAAVAARRAAGGK